MNSIGDILRSAREEHKIPIAQVSRDTKISEKYLMAMEAGELSLMPALTYAKGFIKIYAEYLGIDPRPLLEQLTEEREEPVKQQFPAAAEVPFITSSMKRAAIWTVGAVLIVALAVSLVAILRSCAAPREDKLAAGTEELETLPIPPVPLVEQKQVPAPEPAPVQREASRKKLVARAREDVWVKVYADKVLLFQGTVKKGKEESWTANETFDLRIGKPRSVELSLDGKVIKDFSSREAQNISIDKEGKMTFSKGKLRVE